MSDPRKVVVLGGSGFLGGALCAELARRGTDVVSHSSATLDLTRREALAALDPVVGPETTLVVVSGLAPSRGQSVGTAMANITMAANVGAYLDGHPVGHCVYLGTDAVYGFDVDQVTETAPVTPTGFYALGKYAAERLLATACGAHGVRFAALRLTAMFGPGDPHGSYGPNQFARALAKERRVRMFGGGEETRDHLYVADAARLIAALLAARAEGVVNVASGVSRSFADVVAVAQSLVPYEVAVEALPRRGPITHRRFDVAGLRAAVGPFEFTPFDRAMRATLEAFNAL